MSGILIIAEAGVNHNGDINLAKQLVRIAKGAGADIVKFQTFDPKRVASRFAEMADYQKENMGKVESQEEMLSKMTLEKEEYIELALYCKEMGIGFLSTPFDIPSIHFLDKIQDKWKIPSGEITNYPYLIEIAKTEKEVILSTGMSTLQEIDDALDVLKNNGVKKVTLLHCTTSYPTLMKDVNLRAMITLKEHCGCDVGYSDHTKGIEVPIAATVLGAKVIEKHFTIDRNMVGPDHKASLEPEELESMVKAIRNVEVSLGDGFKEPTQSEKENAYIARKSIIASRDIKAGEHFTEENITTKRPGQGINPMRWNEILGLKASRDFVEDELIEL